MAELPTLLFGAIVWASAMWTIGPMKLRGPLEKAQYTGETRRWNFERYVSLHKKQHQLLGDLKELGHTSLDLRSKVRHLLNGNQDRQTGFSQVTDTGLSFT